MDFLKIFFYDWGFFLWVVGIFLVTLSITQMFYPITLIWISFLIKLWLFADPPISFMRISLRHHNYKTNWKEEQLYLQTNITGTINLLKGFMRGSIKYQIKGNGKYLKNAEAGNNPQSRAASARSGNRMQLVTHLVGSHQLPTSQPELQGCFMFLKQIQFQIYILHLLCRLQFKGYSFSKSEDGNKILRGQFYFPLFDLNLVCSHSCG